MRSTSRSPRRASCAAFDAMDLGRRNGYVLVATDGCVPYRTSWAFTSRYNGPAVAEILRRDFDTNGAPLVLRMDRARAHDAPAVRDLLDRDGVLELHGPAYYAPYYGQLGAPEPRASAVDGCLQGAARSRQHDGRSQRTMAAQYTRLEHCRGALEEAPVIDVDRNALAEDVHEWKHNHQALLWSRRSGGRPRLFVCSRPPRKHPRAGGSGRRRARAL